MTVETTATTEVGTVTETRDSTVTSVEIAGIGIL